MARSMLGASARGRRGPPGERDLVPSGPSIQHARCASVLPAVDWPSTDRIASPGRMPATAPGRRETRPRRRCRGPPPGQTASRRRPGRRGARDPRRRRAGGDIARVRIEVVEQLVEEALHDALRAGAAHRRRDLPAAASGKLVAAAGPAVDVGVRRRRLAATIRSRRSSAKLPSRQACGQVRVERGQPAQPPDRQLRDRHRLQCARRHEGERRGIDVGQRDADRSRRAATVWARARERSATERAGQRRGSPGPRSPPLCAVGAALARARLAGCGTPGRRSPGWLPPAAPRPPAPAGTRGGCDGRSASAPFRHAARNRPAATRTGTMPLAPLLRDCDEKSEARHAGNSCGEIRANFVRHVCSKVTVDRVAFGELRAPLGRRDVQRGVGEAAGSSAASRPSPSRRPRISARCTSRSA